MNNTIYAPWNEEFVTKLNEQQKQRNNHPYTCGSGNRSNLDHRAYAEKFNQYDYGILVATTEGWYCPVPGCNYKQTWAYYSQF